MIELVICGGIALASFGFFVWALLADKKDKLPPSQSVEDVVFNKRLEEIHRRQREIRQKNNFADDQDE